MTKNKVLLISVLSALAGVSVAAAEDGGAPHFGKLDTNGDGTVTTAEFEAGALARFTRSDTNKDGKVTADEAKAHFAAHKQEMFEKKDANGNGVLERAEVARMPEQRFARIDGDKSGTLSPSELESAHPFRGAKGKAWRGHHKGLPGDANGDGVLTQDEAVTGAKSFAKKLDANGDGKLTQDELARGHGHRGACDKKAE